MGGLESIVYDDGVYRVMEYEGNYMISESETWVPGLYTSPELAIAWARADVNALGDAYEQAYPGVISWWPEEGWA